MWFTLAGCLYIDDDLLAERLDELSPPADTAETPTEPTPTDPTPTPTTELPTDPPQVASIAPDFGTSAGGTELTLTGGPFAAGDPAMAVRIGEASARVISATPDTLVVETLASPTVGRLDVVVATSGGETTVPGGFTFWADATGKVGATGELVWFFLAGEQWSDDEEPYGRSTLRFTEAADFQFFQYWAPALDTCTKVNAGIPEYTFEPEVTSIDTLGGDALQTAPSAEIALTWNGAEQRFVNYDLDAGQVVPGEAYDLSVVNAPGLPDLFLDAAFRVPDRFELTSPAIDGSTAPGITADHHFEWTAPDEAAALLLQIGLMNADETAFEEELHCAVRDVGSFWLPSEMWTAWVPDRVVHVLIGRYNVGSGLLPWNQGRLEVASQVWYYGIGRSE